MAPSWLRREVFVGLALGQFVSLLITSTGFSSSELARRALCYKARNVQIWRAVNGSLKNWDCVNAPTSQSLLNYILLAIVYGGILIYRRQSLTIKWYYFLILGIVDVEANYIVVKAYQYTSLTSVMLIDCWAIPCVILLTWVFLKTKYGLRKFIGVAICVAGIIMVVFSDVHASDRAKGPNPLKGDLFVIAGSMLYAVSNVTEEYFVKKSSRIEVMAMLGVFGAVISARKYTPRSHFLNNATEAYLNDKNFGQPTGMLILPFIGFAVAMFLFYSTVPIILKICGATMLNLSLLTSDMWAVLIRIFAYHEKVSEHQLLPPHTLMPVVKLKIIQLDLIRSKFDNLQVDWMYFVAFAGTAAGLIIYSYNHSPMRILASRGSKEAAEETAQVAVETDEEAATQIPGAGEDEPASNKEVSSWAATTSR
uniref:EamA domain-containing protein n=1 Tax=Leersia perrieri TaxID=77586 RepID=A0A0D9XFK1_9ORYZ